MHRATLVLALAALGCTGAPGATQTCGYPKLDRDVLVLETSTTFDSSALARLSGGCLTEQPADIVLGPDQTLLAAHGKPYLGLDDEGTLAALDPKTLALGPRIELYRGALALSSDAAHGIYGVDVDSNGDLWVSRDDAGSVAVVKPDGTVVGKVDISDLDAGDHIPDMNGILVTGGRAYVAVGFLHIESPVVHPRRSGAIVVIDTATRTRITGIDPIDLKGSNPVHALVPTDATMSEIVVATPGVFDEKSKTDGIYRVELDGSGVTQVMSEGEQGKAQADDDTVLDGSVSELVWASDHEAYAIVLGAVPSVNPTRVVQIDPSQHRITRVLASADAFVHSGLALAGDFVLVGDRTPDSPRILAFPRAGGDAREIPTTVLAPFALLALSP